MEPFLKRAWGRPTFLRVYRRGRRLGRDIVLKTFHKNLTKYAPRRASPRTFSFWVRPRAHKNFNELARAPASLLFKVGPPAPVPPIQLFEPRSSFACRNAAQGRPGDPFRKVAHGGTGTARAAIDRPPLACRPDDRPPGAPRRFFRQPAELTCLFRRPER